MLGKYCLCFSDEILDEYEEIIEQRTGSAEIAHSVVNAIINRSNTRHIEVYYHFDLIEADKDDNKFVDCAVAANATYIVSDDKHFAPLKEITFPQLLVIKLMDFVRILNMQ